jgi:hypothetical protein
MPHAFINSLRNLKKSRSLLGQPPQGNNSWQKNQHWPWSYRGTLCSDFSNIPAAEIKNCRSSDEFARSVSSGLSLFSFSVLKMVKRSNRSCFIVFLAKVFKAKVTPET